MPIATSPWPMAPGAAERVGDRRPRARRRPPRSAARSARAEASGSTRQQDDGAGRRRWRRRRRRWRRRSRGACGRSARRARARTISAVSSRMTCDVARVLAVLGGELERSRRRLDVGERDDPALGLGHDLVREHEHVAVAKRPPRCGEQRGEVVAGPISGRPRAARVAADAAHATGERPATASSAWSVRRRGPPRARERGAQRLQVGRVSTSRSATPASRRRATRAPASCGELRRGARGCRGRSAARSRPGGVSSSPLVPVPWRSGTITTPAPRLRRRAARRSRRVQQRAVAGGEQDALGAQLRRAARRRAARRRLWPACRRSSGTTSAP